MNPASDDSLDWLAALGLVVLGEQPDGSARTSGASGVNVAHDVSAALAQTLGLSPDDARLAELVERARAEGKATLEVAGARVGLVLVGERLRGVVVPVDRTAAGVVHELANALTGIAGWTRLAAGCGPLPARARSALEALARASDDALDTARTLLASLRGPVDVGEGCDVGDVVGGALTTIRPLADAKDVTIRARLPEGVRVAARAAEMRAIAINLIKNAIEALEPGGEIIVALEHGEASVVLSVVDDGPGLDDEAIARIFDPWVSGKRGGTGLGLALVRDLVRARGGEVRAESGRKRGARFLVRLPLLAAGRPHLARGAPAGREGAAHRSAVRRRPTAHTRRAERPLRVLIVEDDPSIQAMMRTAFELRGARVESADGVTTAAARGSRVDLAVVDLRLRDGRGDHLVAWLREQRLARWIVITTGGSATPVEAQGADAILHKPFTVDDLVEIVDRLTPTARTTAR